MKPDNCQKFQVTSKSESAFNEIVHLNPAKMLHPAFSDPNVKSVIFLDMSQYKKPTPHPLQKVTFDKPPTFELASKGCHGSYSPRLAESKMRAERLNRPACGDPKPAVDISPQRLYQRTRSLSSENILKDAPLRVVSLVWTWVELDLVFCVWYGMGRLTRRGLWFCLKLLGW